MVDLRPRTSSRVVLAVALAGALAGCAPRTPDVPPMSIPSHILVRHAGRVDSVPLEDYVLAAALAEVTPLNESAGAVERIYEIQAILARTYVASHLGRHRADGFDVCDATHCELYEPDRIRTSRFSAAARHAVTRTAGLVLTYSQRPVEALFHSDCGGVTASADATWGGPPVPYLLSAPDDVPSLTHRKWRFAVGMGRLRTVLEGDSRTRTGGRLDGLEVVERDFSGRAVLVAAKGAQSPTVRGEQLRAILNQALGDRAILSTRFTITKTGSNVVFEGTGFGHGVGLCQAGAAARARQGELTDAILTHYFPGARLVKGH